VSDVRARRGLGTGDLDQLSAAGRVEAVSRRTIVPLDGPTLVIVIGGYFRIFRNAAFVRDVTLGLASRGDVLAANAAFGDRPSETGAEALSDGHVLLLAPDAWSASAAVDPGLSVRFAASIGRRVERLQKRLEELSRSGVEGRVAACLLELGDDFGVATPAGRKLDLPFSQEDLARLAGTTRETCSSIVTDFGRRGIVRGGRLRGMLLLDVPALEELSRADHGLR
jgi:CRP/FNR family cyclic AMP-dependent transcriptional regulator